MVEFQIDNSLISDRSWHTLAPRFAAEMRRQAGTPSEPLEATYDPKPPPRVLYTPAEHYPSGLMFWLTRNMFVGSYLFLSATSFLYLAEP